MAQSSASLSMCLWRACAAAAAAVLLAVSSAAGAVTLGNPVLESGLGESLRIILPVIPTGRERLTVECVKLRAGGELNDISDGVRADVVTTGERQALVLTTVRPVNELVISVGVSLECGAFFLRRYTFLLDLPPAERRGAATPAASQTLQAAALSPETQAAPAAAAGTNINAATAATTATTNRTRTATATAAATSAAASQRTRAAPLDSQSTLKSASRSPSGAASKSNPAIDPGALAGQVRAGPVRPEDEPGVLARTGRGTPNALSAARTTRAPLAPPVRSMLKIELGGIDEFLASQPRLLLEQSTGMRVSTDISAPDRQSKAAIAADSGFKQAHARYIAAMRDAPDPVATENEALGKRLDAFSKDLSSLRLDLQSTRARADALEASHVPWWWLLIAAALAALTAGAGAAWWTRRRESRPAGRPLIHVDSPFLGKAASASGDAAAEPAHKRDFTATVELTRAERARRIARGEPDPEAAAAPVSAVSDTSAAEVSATPEPVAEADPPRDTSPDLASFNLPRFDKPATLPPAVEQAIATASTTIAAAVAAREVPAAPLKVDKNSLTQQLAAMTDLSDEAWASYRHPSDTNAVATPFGAGATASPAPAPAPAPAFSLDDLQIDFSLEPESKQGSPVAVEAIKTAQVLDAGMISTSDISSMNEPPPLDDAQQDAARVPGASLSPVPASKGNRTLALELRDPPHALKAAGSTSAMTLAPIEASAPDMAESEKMREVMAAASSVMEAAHQLMQEGHPGSALRMLGTYLEAAPPQAPPGPWVQLAHALHDVGMQNEYVEAQALFKERFGADLPNWEAAYELKRHPMGLARVTGIEIMVAAGRGKPELIGRLAGLAYRVAVPPEVLFDVLLHRELLQQVAQTQIASPHLAGAGGDHVDFSL